MTLEYCMTIALQFSPGVSALDIRLGKADAALKALGVFSWLADKTGCHEETAAIFVLRPLSELRAARWALKTACALNAATAADMEEALAATAALEEIDRRRARPDANLTPMQIAAKIVASDTGAMAMSIAHLRRLAVGFLAQAQALAVAEADIETNEQENPAHV